MSKKISEYDEITELNDFYIVGSQEQNDSLVTCKYNLGTLKNGIQKTLNQVQGEGSIAEFNINTIYYPGNFVKHNGYIWRFIKTHLAGPWDNEDVFQTSTFNELESLRGVDNETIYVSVTSDDGGVNVAGKTITITYKDSSTITQVQTQNDGKCTVFVPKGNVYTMSIGSVTNYITPDPFESIYANSNERYLNFVYSKNMALEYCDVRVNVYVGNQKSSLLDTQTLDIFTTGAAQRFSTATVVDGSALFTNVPKNRNCTVYAPTMTGYAKPTDKNFITYDASNNLDLVYRVISDASGFLWVADEAHGYAEYTIDDFPVADASCIALHVCTETLTKLGYDYYVKIGDMIRGRRGVCVQYASIAKVRSGVGIPAYSSSNPNNSGYNGKEQTYILSKDCRKDGGKSQLCDYANSQTLVLKNKILIGYVGTIPQYNFILQTDYVTNCLSFLGYTPVLKNIGIQPVSAWDYYRPYWDKTWWYTPNQLQTGSADCLPIFSF